MLDFSGLGGEYNFVRQEPSGQRSAASAPDSGVVNGFGAVQEDMRGTITSVQFLRFVAAALVVFNHAVLALNQHFPGSVLKTLLNSSHFGASGVHIFFVISGFIMVYTSFHDNVDGSFSPSQFLVRRVLRIYPIYFVYCGLYVLFYRSFFATPFLSIQDLIGTLLLLPGYSAKIIGPGWTLAYEMYFYLCFGVAMVAGLKRGMQILTIFFLSSVSLRFLIDTTQQPVFLITNSLLTEFLLGAWLGYAVVTQVRVPNPIAGTMVVLGLSGFITGMLLGFDRLPATLMWGVPSALLVAGFVFFERNGQIPWFVRQCSFLGDSSYSLYLLHVVLIDAAIVLIMNCCNSISTYIGQAGAPGIIFVCFFFMAYGIAVAVIFYDLIERKLTDTLRNLLRRPNVTLSADRAN